MSAGSSSDSSNSPVNVNQVRDGEIVNIKNVDQSKVHYLEINGKIQAFEEVAPSASKNISNAKDQSKGDVSAGPTLRAFHFEKASEELANAYDKAHPDSNGKTSGQPNPFGFQNQKSEHQNLYVKHYDDMMKAA